MFLTSLCVPLALVSFCLTVTTFCVWHRLNTLTPRGFDLSRSVARLLFPRLAFKFDFLVWQFSSSTIGLTEDSFTLHLRWLDLVMLVVLMLSRDVGFAVGTIGFLTASCRVNANPCLLTEPGPVLIAGNFVLDFFSHLMREVLRQTVAVVPLELYNIQHRSNLAYVFVTQLYICKLRLVLKWDQNARHNFIK